MASKQSNVDFVLEQMADAGPVSARKMFGEYAIYCNDKIVALFCDDQLFVKPTTAGKTFIGKVKEGAPYPGAKPWFLISGDRCEDGEWLSQLIIQTERELPPPKPKTPKRKLDKKAAAKPKTSRRAATAKTSSKLRKKKPRKG
jgi:DNA transformation protein